jgi:acetyl esterase/lipase
MLLTAEIMIAYPMPERRRQGFVRPGWAWRWLLIAILSIAPLLGFAQPAPAEPEAFSLWNGHSPVGDGTFQTEDPQIFLHRPAHPNGAAAVICPGGGYGGLVIGAEGHGIAQWLNQHGITGVVLKYRLPKGHAMVPLLDAQRAIRLTRLHAKEWGIDPKRIGIIGFSAGGHLASTAGTHFDAGNPQSTDAAEKVSCRPDFMILVYPVVSMGEKGHAGSRKNLLGADASPELIEKFSNEKQVTAQTPPAFLAHAKDDKVVPSENSQALYDALQAHKVAAKYLELPEGGHGLNHYQGPMWDEWQTQSLQWLAELKLIPEADSAAAK